MKFLSGKDSPAAFPVKSLDFSQKGAENYIGPGEPEKQAKAGAYEVFAHVGPPGPRAVIPWPYRW